MRVESWLFSMGSSLALLSLLWLLSSPGLQLGQCAALCLFPPSLSTRKGTAPSLSDAAPYSEGFLRDRGLLAGAGHCETALGFLKQGLGWYVYLPGPPSAEYSMLVFLFSVSHFPIFSWCTHV